MSDVATQSSTTDHVGTFTATGITSVDGENVLLLGDVYVCSISAHGTNAVATASEITKDLQGTPIAFVGCTTECGATILTGQAGLQLTG